MPRAELPRASESPEIRARRRKSLDAASDALKRAVADLSIDSPKRRRRRPSEDVLPYGSLNLRVVFEQIRTGFEEGKELDAPVGGVVAGRYEVRGLIGRAAFSSTHAALDLDGGGDDSPARLCGPDQPRRGRDGRHRRERDAGARRDEWWRWWQPARARGRGLDACGDADRRVGGRIAADPHRGDGGGEHRGRKRRRAAEGCVGAA